MNWKRIGQVFVCFLLICCLLINQSPIKAHALGVGVSIGLGIMGALILVTAGVALHPETAEDFVAIGNSMTTSLREWGRANSREAEVESWIAGIQIYDYVYNGGNDDPDGPRDYKTPLARGLLAGISAWCASIILGTSDIKTQTPGQDGFAYFNGVYMPIPISSVWENHQYKFLVREGDQYIFYSSDYPCKANPVTFQGGDYFTFGIGTSCWVYKLQEDGSYKSNSSTLNNAAYATYRDEELVWANHDVVHRYQTDKIYLPASEPMTTEEYILSPFFVGDIPQKVQDGEIDEENIPLPLEIDLEKLFERTGTTTAQEAVQKTLEQLNNGQLSYDEFMDSIKVEDVPGENPEDPENPPAETEPGSYTLDLTEFFPFCIPFDIYEFLTLLAAEPEAPVFHWEIPVPQLGQTFEIDIDLSEWDSVALLFRRLELLAFILGLAYVTREKYIRS